MFDMLFLICGELLCKIGYHTWRWKLDVVNLADSNPPAHAKCGRCGQYYDKNFNNTLGE